MIVLKLELWPGGDRSRSKLLGLVTIVNDGSGTVTSGNYLVTIFKRNSVETVWKRFKLYNYPRKSANQWELVRRALQIALGGKK